MLLNDSNTTFVHNSVYGPGKEIVTDLDIVTNTHVIQVKVGGGKGIAGQLYTSQEITNLKVIGFDANKLIGSSERFKYWVMKDARKQGFTIYNDVEDLLDLLQGARYERFISNYK